MAHAALRVAIELIHVPSRVRIIRSQPLPDGVLILLRIMGGDEHATSEALKSVELPRQLVRQAAAFFIEQILLCPDADSYRVLGATPEASNAELRRNMALLLRWLHPDLKGERSVFAGRVTSAWNNLKTRECRAAYDRSLRTTLAGKSPSSSGRARPLFVKRASNKRLRYHSQDHKQAGRCEIIAKRRYGLIRRVLLYLLTIDAR